MKFVYPRLLLLLNICIVLPLSATELIYAPTNPTFGGSPLNGAFLLGKAQSQNDHSSGTSRSSSDPLSRFEESLQRNILNQIAKQVADLAFGEEGLELGEAFDGFDTEQYTIDINTLDSDFITITITDKDTGDLTTIQIPVYGSTDISG